jgi:hypothetical protein
MTVRLRAEVQPLLEAIEVMQQRAAAIREAAESQRTALIETANHDAAQRIRAAEADAPKARLAAGEQRWRAVDVEIASALSTAQAEVARIEHVSRDRSIALVEKIRACILRGQGLTS